MRTDYVPRRTRTPPPFCETRARARVGARARARARVPPPRREVIAEFARSPATIRREVRSDRATGTIDELRRVEDKRNREEWELPVFLRLLIVLPDIVLAVVLGLAVLLSEILLRNVLAEILALLIGHRAL